VAVVLIIVYLSIYVVCASNEGKGGELSANNSTYLCARVGGVNAAVHMHVVHAACLNCMHAAMIQLHPRIGSAAEPEPDQCAPRPRVIANQRRGSGRRPETLPNALGYYYYRVITDRDWNE